MIYKLDSTYLKSECVDFDFDNPPIDPLEFFTNLKDTMVHLRGLGLSANQVGFPYKVFVMGDYKKPDDILGIFNPKILNLTGDQLYDNEGCLSLPGLALRITRYNSVRFRARNAKGETDTTTFNGLSARIFQHEYDHTQGRLITDISTKLRLDMALKKCKVKYTKLQLMGKEKIYYESFDKSENNIR